MDNYQFERTVVEVLTEIIESRGLKHDVIAKSAWPDKGAAGRRWQSIRNGDSPQRMTLRDAHAMAEKLNLSMTALCGIVEGRAIEEAMRQHVDAPLKNAESEVEANAPTRPNLPARKPGDGVQPVVGGASQG